MTNYRIRRKRGAVGSEISNWWFSDEDLAEAVSLIVDTPTPRRVARKRAARKMPDNTQEVTLDGNKE